MIRKNSSDLRCAICGKPADTVYKHVNVCKECLKDNKAQIDKIDFSESKPSDK